MWRSALPLSLILLGGPVAAQHLREPYLPVDHWSRAALLRLASLDAIPTVQAVRAWPLRRDEVRRLLAEAVADPDEMAATVAREQLRAFEVEFAPPGGPALVMGLDGGWEGAHGLLLGGTSLRDAAGAWVYPGPTPRAMATGAAARTSAEITVPHLTASFAALSGDGWSSDEAWINAGFGPVDLWAGRRGLDFGPGGGAFVLSTDVAFDGAGIRTSRTLSAPGLFGFLGVIDASFQIARFDRSGTVLNPWFAASRIVLSPARRLTIGLNRAAIFGGSGNVQATTLRNLVFVLGGLTSQLGKDSGYENQVASIDLRYGAGAGGLPFAMHGELAIDDVGFNMFRTAAYTLGVDLPVLPRTGLSLGIEHTRIPGSCCTQPPWYRHGDLGDGWTEGGRLLGHPLGGHGTEWRLRFLRSSRALQLGGEILTRARGQENLLAPDHGGPSVGGSLNAVAPVANGLVLSVGASAERGEDGWWAWQARFGVRVRLHVAGSQSGGSVRGNRLTGGSPAGEARP